MAGDTQHGPVPAGMDDRCGTDHRATTGGGGGGQDGPPASPTMNESSPGPGQPTSVDGLEQAIGGMAGPLPIAGDEAAETRRAER